MGIILSVNNCSANLINDTINKSVSSMLYYPPNNYYNRNIPNNTVVYSINEVSVMKISPDNNLHLNKVIIFSHGNATDIYTMASYLKYISNLFGITCICYDYPGYGDTKGSPTEKSCVECLNIVINDTQKKYKYIILVGQSLGTGIVIDYVSNSAWSFPILLISPYKSIPRVINDCNMIDSVTSHHCYQSVNKIKNATCPIKIVHGELDTLIPISHAEDLNRLIKNKTFSPTYISDADHNNILNKIDNIYQELIDYFQ